MNQMTARFRALLSLALLLPPVALAQAVIPPSELTTGTQTVAGAKTFTSPMTTDNVIPSTALSKTLGNATNLWISAYLATIKDANNTNRLICPANQGNTYIAGNTSPTTGTMAHLYNTPVSYPADSFVGCWENSGAVKMCVYGDGTMILAKPPSLQTCTALLEGSLAVVAGASGTRTKLCMCSSDGAGTPAFAWQNIAGGAVGTTTTCG